MDNRTIPKVSVVMSTYRESVDLVRQATESILGQTYDNLELIVVIDDRNNHSVVSYLNNLSQNNTNVLLFTNQSPQGLAACRNRGIKESQGEYVALMDADDISEAARLEKQIKFIENNNCDLTFSHIKYISEENAIMGYLEPNLYNKSVAKQLLAKHLFVHPSCLGKRKVFLANPYDEKFLRSQDLDLWLRLTQKNYRFCILPEKLLRYRLYRNSDVKKRVTRQRGYALYSSKIFFKHFKNLWYLPEFWFFGVKRFSYLGVLYFIPIPILSWVVKFRDRVLKR